MRKLSKKLVIADMPVEGRNCLAVALFGEEGAEELFVMPEQRQQILGNIYVGQVEKVSEHTGAVFVRISSDRHVYLPLNQCAGAIYKTRKKNRKIRPGDELLVQVEKEALKSKLPRASAVLRLPGSYLVVTTDGPGLNFSRRLSGQEKTELRELFSEEESPFGIIVRTNAREAGAEDLRREKARLERELSEICSRGISRNFGSCLYRAPSDWIRELLRIPRRELSRVITDDVRVRDSFQDYFGPENAELLEWYQDRLLPLYKLYSMEALTERSLHERVWLGSGGFLVIQQTEAFAAIDVNTGKYDGKQSEAETVRQVNLEAAREAARQIRLRQLSGVILIDFINMKQGEDRRELLSEMRRLVREDPVKTEVVDLTALDIMEITRRKERRSLKEQISLLKEGAGPEANA